MFLYQTFHCSPQQWKNFSSLIASKEQTVKRELEKERGQPDPFLSYHITRVRLHMCRSEIEN
jgi:hypothetical protein